MHIQYQCVRLWLRCRYADAYSEDYKKTHEVTGDVCSKHCKLE
ncbi:hypothetical protein KUCAC02_000121 [Chaenocephalus aceratus]|nr:hypothetical protein KUCAC02_000121 [Chaenocephalus aceratus]